MGAVAVRYALARQVLVSAALVLTAAACAEPPTRPQIDPEQSAPSVHAGRSGLVDWLKGYIANPSAPGSAQPAVLAGAGDIARCYPGPNFQQFQPPGPDHPAMRTSNLLLEMQGATVMAVGDNAYEFGAYPFPPDYAGCYDPTWGRVLERTRPTPGNHEYLTPAAAGYFAYYKDRAWPSPLPPGTDPALPGNGYYSYNVGDWHVVAINSTPQVYLCYPPEQDEIPELNNWVAQLQLEPSSPATGRACAGDAAQQAWLVADLFTHRNYRCTAVYFHHPRFSSGKHGNHYQMQRIWDILYTFGVELAIVGHDHLYERFAPQDLNGRRDDTWGIRQFVVGTGGAEFYGIDEIQPNSEVRINDRYGVIALALDPGRYAWAFVDVDKNVLDSGSGDCHDRPPPGRLRGR
jgi:acid phosphatase type 7